MPLSYADQQQVGDESPTKTIAIIFDQQKEMLDIIDSTDAIHRRMLGESAICPLIGSSIRLATESIGEGSYGSVFAVSIPGYGDRQFIAKVIKGSVTHHKYKGDGARLTLSDVANERDIPINALLAYNPAFKGDANKPVGNRAVALPYYTRTCGPLPSSTERREVRTLVNRAMPNRDLVDLGTGRACPESVVEVLAGTILGSTARAKEGDLFCINFVETFAFALCKGRPGVTRRKTTTDRPADIVNEYIFMERCDTDLDRMLNTCRFPSIDTPEGVISMGDIIDGIVLQCVMAMACMERRRITHGDLHGGNVFLTLIRPGMEHDGQNLWECDAFRYWVGEQELFIDRNRCPWIVKIGDFGFSSICPAGKPWTVSRAAAEYDPLLASIFLPCYDMFMFLQQFRLMEANARMGRKSLGGTISPKISAISSLASRLNVEARKRFDNPSDLRYDHGRPILRPLVASEGAIAFTAYRLLVDNPEIFEPFFVRPPEGARVVTLGEF